LLPLSLRETAALPDLAARYLEVLETAPNLDTLCYTAAVGRNHFAKARSLVASDQNILGDQLAALAHGKVADGIVQGKAGQYAPRMALLFSGQGRSTSAWGWNCTVLNRSSSRTSKRCAALLEGQLDRPLLEILAESDRHPPDSLHPQRSLPWNTAWRCSGSPGGSSPELLLGHSVGELAAACVAGVFSLEDGLRLVAARGRLMGSLPQEGEMVALPVSEVRAREADCSSLCRGTEPDSTRQRRGCAC
jgi:acyl transferase domain-containing protein